MQTSVFPVIDLPATGDNIRRLREARGLKVRDLQTYFGFEEPRAIYKWQKGETLPTVDNLYALGALLGVPMEDILVPVPGTRKSKGTAAGTAPAACDFFRGFSGRSGYGGRCERRFNPFSLRPAA